MHGWAAYAQINASQGNDVIETDGHKIARGGDESAGSAQDALAVPDVEMAPVAHQAARGATRP